MSWQYFFSYTDDIIEINWIYAWRMLYIISTENFQIKYHTRQSFANYIMQDIKKNMHRQIMTNPLTSTLCSLYEQTNAMPHMIVL